MCSRTKMRTDILEFKARLSFFLSDFSYHSPHFLVSVLWNFRTVISLLYVVYRELYTFICVLVVLLHTIHTTNYTHVSNPRRVNRIFRKAFIFDTFFFSLSLYSVSFLFVLNFTVVLLPLACCIRINDFFFGMVRWYTQYRWLACFKTIFRSIKCLYFL